MYVGPWLIIIGIICMVGLVIFLIIETIKELNKKQY